MKALIGTVLAVALLVSFAPASVAAQDINWDSVKSSWSSLSESERDSYRALMNTSRGPNNGRANVLGTPMRPMNRVPGDTCGAATLEISALPFGAAGNTDALTNDYDIAGIGGACDTGFDSASTDDVYLVRTDITCDVTASQDGAFDEVIYVSTGCPDILGGCIGADDSGSPETVSFTATAGTDYYVVVDGWGAGGTGDYTLDITEDTATGCALIPVELTGFDVE